ncbi:MAG: hypothetical protein AAGJ81_14590 [Verrucomicrobiota bacterium]
MAYIVARPLYISDSRTVLEVRFSGASQTEEVPEFKITYDRGLGFKSLRVVDPFHPETDDSTLYRWEFDSRPIQAVQVGILGWQGPLTIERARIVDGAGTVLYRFEPKFVRLAEGSTESYPLPQTSPGTYYRLILPVEGEIIPVNRSFSAESFRSTLIGFALGAFVFFFAFQLCRTAPLWMSWVSVFRAEYRPAVQVAVPRRSILYGSIVLLVGLIFYRSWEVFSFPSLFVEDTFHYFNYNYANRNSLWDALGRNPNGYLNLFPNLMGWVFGYLDVRWVAAAYVWLAVSVCLLTVFLPVLAGLFRNSWIVFLVPLVLGLSGLNHIFYLTTLTYQMYIVVLILLVILFWRAPNGWFGLAVRVALGAFLIFSGPYSVVAVPLGLFLLVVYKPSRQSSFWASMVYVGVVFTETSASVVRLENVLEPAVVERMFTVVVDRIFFLGLFDPGPLVGTILVCAVLILLYLLLKRDGEFLRIGTGFLLITVLGMAPLFLSQKFSLYPDPYDCHVLVSQFFWLIFLLFSVDRLMGRFRGMERVGPVLAVLVAVFLWVDHVKHPQKGYLEPNPEMQDFLDKVHSAELLKLEERNEFVLLESTGAMQDAFEARVRVGSARPDAREVAEEDLVLP